MKLILFDFDGVLIDTLLICYSIDAKHQGFSLEEYKSLFESNIYDAPTPEGKALNYKLDYFDHYDRHTRELKVPEELKKLLKELEKNYTLTIVSSTVTSSIEGILAREGVRPYFKDILGSDVHTSKVVKNKMLLDKYKVLPEEALFITDTVGDIMEARACEIKSIAVTWGFHDEKTLAKAKPAKIVNTPAELAEAIKEI